MKEKYNKYYLLIKHGFTIETLNEMSECEMTMYAEEIIKKLTKE
jgi:hypothetical protein